MIERLRQEAIAGFPRLAGARLTGHVPVSQAVVDEVLARIPQAPSGLALELHAGNQVVARYGPMRATAVLDETVALHGGPPRIGLELASGVVAWTIKQMLRNPALSVVGRRLTIDIGALPGAEGYRACWPHLQRVRLVTMPGQLHIHFDLAVE